MRVRTMTTCLVAATTLGLTLLAPPPASAATAAVGAGRPIATQVGLPDHTDAGVAGCC